MLRPEDIEPMLATNIKWLAPVCLLAMQFLMKLFIGEIASGPKLWTALLYLPVQIGFMALSFTMTSIMISGEPNSARLITLVIYILLLIMSVLIWRNTPDHLAILSILKAILMSLVNLVVTLNMLVYSITLIMN